MRPTTMEKYLEVLNWFCSTCNRTCTEKHKLECIGDSIKLASMASDIIEGKNIKGE